MSLFKFTTFRSQLHAYQKRSMDDGEKLLAYLNAALKSSFRSQLFALGPNKIIVEKYYCKLNRKFNRESHKFNTQLDLARGPYVGHACPRSRVMAFEDIMERRHSINITL